LLLELFPSEQRRYVTHVGRRWVGEADFFLGLRRSSDHESDGKRDQ